MKIRPSFERKVALREEVGVGVDVDPDCEHRATDATTSSYAKICENSLILKRNRK
jgi:hypothetical protein